MSDKKLEHPSTQPSTHPICTWISTDDISAFYENVERLPSFNNENLFGDNE